MRPARARTLLARLGLLLSPAVAAVAIAGSAQAESHDLQHGLSDARARAAPAPQPLADEARTQPSYGFAWPVRGTVTSPFGQRWGRLHSGLDVAAPAGTPVVASASGRIVYAGSMSGYGLLVVVQHPGGIATAYAHNSSIAVAVGQSVGQGQSIAAIGCTGSCYGDHVHFEVRAGGSPVDPMGYLSR